MVKFTRYWLLPTVAVSAIVSSVAASRSPAASAVATASPEPAASDSSDVADTVERFHRALAEADSATVARLLAPDAVILESGEIETRAEYLAHHLPADIAFANSVRQERRPIQVVVRGDAAWTSAISVARGEYRGRPINSAGAELMVLYRTSNAWRISAIHWSSRTIRP